jgi:GntR family transcriptional repressor for pyruvate dehydrogenase complex
MVRTPAMSSRFASPGAPRPEHPGRPKLSEEIARILLTEIRTRELPPGTRLPSERELMAQLQVGRSTIREVINGLAILGAIEVRHGQGAFVRDPDATAPVPNALAAALARGVTRDLFEARRVVEVHTARLAAARRTPGDMSALDEILHEHDRAIATGISGVGPSVRFHVRLAWAAGNEILTQTVKSVANLLSERGPGLEALAGYREWELGEHRAVLAAVATGDADRAAARMEAHLDQVIGWHGRLTTGSASAD